MAPVIRALEQHSGIQSFVCITGQHRTMLQQVMEVFRIKADYDLDIMAPGQTLNDISGRIFSALVPVLESVKPDRVIVHGDTTTAMVAGLACFHRQIPVAHLEAGLRTGDLSQPWPEEMNRRVLDVVCDLLLAPTATARTALQKENLAGRIVVTGNTVIDALKIATQQLENDNTLCEAVDRKLPQLDPARKILLVTGHRRENFGNGFLQICHALAGLAERNDIEIVYPVHLNPNVQEPVNRILSMLPNVHLIAPLDYLAFVRLMQRAHVILTESGGVQEEAPSIGKPVLVMRDVTERPEAVLSGAVRLVGTVAPSIVHGVNTLFDDARLYAASSRAVSPYGDGLASARIVAALTGGAFQEFQYDTPPRFRVVDPVPAIAGVAG